MAVNGRSQSNKGRNFPKNGRCPDVCDLIAMYGYYELSSEDYIYSESAPTADIIAFMDNNSIRTTLGTYRIDKQLTVNDIKEADYYMSRYGKTGYKSTNIISNGASLNNNNAFIDYKYNNNQSISNYNKAAVHYDKSKLPSELADVDLDTSVILDISTASAIGSRYYYYVNYIAVR